MLASMSSRLLQEWATFYELEPFGEVRADLRSALVANVIANANRNPDKQREPFTLDDFMLKFDDALTPAPSQEERGRKQTWQEQKAILMAWSERR